MRNKTKELFYRLLISLYVSHLKRIKIFVYMFYMWGRYFINYLAYIIKTELFTGLSTTVYAL